ncbi:MAG: hypothetical protein ABUL58_02345 [Steroidobacter sp.]
MSDDFDKTLQQLSQLQKDRAPERDLWPGIEMAVMAKKHRQTPWMAIAASVIACVLGGGILLEKYHDADGQGMKIAEQLDVQHRQDIAALKIAFRNVKPLTTNLDQQLHDMDQAADTIKKALRNDPENVTLLKMLSDVYQKEVDLLKTVHESNLQHPYLI